MLQFIISSGFSLDNLASGYFYTPFLICFCLILLLVVSSRRRQGIPPGPPLLPVIGNLLTLSGKDANGTMRNLREKYGDIFSLYLGQELVIVLNGYHSIHDALVRKGSLFSNRPKSQFQKLAMPESAILFTNGRIWKEQRSFAQKTLKEICFEGSGQHIEEVLTEEAAYVLKKLGEMKGATDIRHVIHVYSLNVILRVILGKRFMCEDENAKYLIDAFHDIGTDVAIMQVLVNCFPFLQSFPGDALSLQKLQAKKVKLQSLFQQFVEETLSNKQECCKTFVEAFEDEIETSESEEKETGSSFTHNRMLHASADLVGAASDTTANAIVWVLLHLVREPSIQDKMFQEIVEMIGLKVEPTLDDRKVLPYTQAVILEGLRISNSTPFALPHSVSEEVRFNDFVFPKDTTILVNLTSVLKDPKIFTDPDEFRPERFLNSDRTELSHVAELVPFSLGPRSCLGESLARMQLFIIISAIIQRFKLLPAEDGKLPDTFGQLTTVYKPQPFAVKLLKR